MNRPNQTPAQIRQIETLRNRPAAPKPATTIEDFDFAVLAPKPVATIEDFELNPAK